MPAPRRSPQHALSDPARDSYPALMGRALGTMEVRNFGVTGATLMKRGALPFWSQPAFGEALAYRPDVMIIVLGTNDVLSGIFSHNKTEFVNDYKALIATFKTYNPNAKVFACYPPPIYPLASQFFTTSGSDTDEIAPLIRQAATQSRATILDLYRPLSANPEVFPTGCTPTLMAPLCSPVKFMTP